MSAPHESGDVAAALQVQLPAAACVIGNMRKLALALVILAAASAGAATKEFHKNVPLAANGSVSLETHNGSVEVAPWAQPAVGIDAKIEPQPDSSHPEDVNVTDVKVTGSGGNVSIVSDYDRVPTHTGFFGMNRELPLIRYVIHIPVTAQVHITTHNASTHVTGVRGDVRVRTHNGATTLRAIEGPIDIESHNGSIDADVAHVPQRMAIESHNGNVTVHLPPDAKFTLRSSSHHSHFESDYAMTQRISGDELHAAVNGGGPELKISVHNGDVRIKKR